MFDTKIYTDVLKFSDFDFGESLEIAKMDHNFIPTIKISRTI